MLNHSYRTACTPGEYHGRYRGRRWRRHSDLSIYDSCAANLRQAFMTAVDSGSVKTSTPDIHVLNNSYRTAGTPGEYHGRDRGRSWRRHSDWTGPATVQDQRHQ